MSLTLDKSWGQRQLQRDCEKIQQAIVVHKDALKETPQNSQPDFWAGTQNNLGLANRQLADLTRDAAALDASAAAYGLSLQVRNPHTRPFDWAITQWNLADLALLRHSFDPDPAHLFTARDHARAARAVFVLGSDYQTARCDDLLARISAAA